MHLQADTNVWPCYTMTSLETPGCSSRSVSGKEVGNVGTCPRCKLRIRKNGNHIKLGSTWYHKACPSKPAAKKA